MAEIRVVRLKLLIDSESQKVLFGEADKNFINFLFNLLSLPLGTVIKVLKNQTMVGSLGKLYESIETLNENYLQPNKSKDTLLNPTVFGDYSSSMLLPETDSSSALARFYVCNSNETEDCHHYFADDPDAVCPGCVNWMDKMCRYVGLEATSEKKGDFVKGLVSYIVMDDLSVMPMSSISSLTILNKFNVSKVDELEEKLITLDVNQCVKLLKASMESKTVLTDVFLEKK